MCTLDTNYDSLSVVRNMIGMTSDLGTSAVPILGFALLLTATSLTGVASAPAN